MQVQSFELEGHGQQVASIAPVCAYFASMPESMDRRVNSQSRKALSVKRACPRRTRMKNNRGFSLLELLIVVAIILIIATIAIPSLLRSRQSAQESSAVAQIRTINTADVTYLSSNGGAYGSLPQLITQGLLDNRFSGSVSGYNFTVDASSTDYTVIARPSS